MKLDFQSISKQGKQTKKGIHGIEYLISSQGSYLFLNHHTELSLIIALPYQTLIIAWTREKMPKRSLVAVTNFDILSLITLIFNL